MIYTVTVNPSLDYYMHPAAPILRGEICRSHSETILASGKGVNVSVVLHRLGAKTMALGFLAGQSGKMYENLLLDCPHDFTFLCSGMTRINVKIYDGAETAINAAGPAVSAQDYQNLVRKLQALTAEDTLVLSGNLQADAPFSYSDLARLAASRGADFAVDTTGKALLDCLPLHPYLIKPNLDELGELFGVRVQTRAHALSLCRELQKQGARNVLVSMGGDGAVLCAETGECYAAVYQKQQPVLTTVGAGDSLVAGVLYAKSQPLERALAWGVAAGSATVYHGALANKAQIEALVPFVKVSAL